jgi:hypothetical protein
MTTQIDNWVERWERFCLEVFQEGSKTLKEAVPTFIENERTLAKAEGVKEEYNRWAHQTANEHYKKIRAEERKRIVEILTPPESWKRCLKVVNGQDEICAMCGFNPTKLIEIIKKID